MEPSSSNSPINSKIIYENNIYDNSMFVDKKTDRILFGPKDGKVVDATNLVAVRLFDTTDDKPFSEEPPKLGWWESKKFVPIKVITKNLAGEAEEVWVKVNKRSLAKRLGISNKEINAMAGKSFNEINELISFSEIKGFTPEKLKESFKALGKIRESISSFILTAGRLDSVETNKLQNIQKKIYENGLHKKDVDAVLKEMNKCLKKIDPTINAFPLLKEYRDALTSESKKLIPYNLNEFSGYEQPRNIWIDNMDTYS